ncbi:hypothetical protein AC792_03625 [Arthrobacter sp. RIT-PI-e]|uniref:hypothetical protein n=1 Tax=Arthrobacter sp. RIT-PI-e TaxID=1681197 RepID=UPI00067680E2|nr:hypothetical protein [Arthrobacter sp. RIT-PI-e]KNC19964.1 hypothetical protein AC792_03625 [Arthrobacter sp. RIT-PI-e]
MADVKGVVQRLAPREISELHRIGPDGPLTPKLLHAIDRAAGGPGEGRGYSVYARVIDRDRPRRFVLRTDVCAELFAPRH